MARKGTTERMRAHTSKAVDRTAKNARKAASNLKARTRGNGRAAADAAAGAMRAVSSSLEALSNGARTSGLVLRDRGRDVARKIARGERVLRERGFGGAARDIGAMSRRNAGKLAIAGAGLVTLLAWRRRNRDNG